MIVRPPTLRPVKQAIALCNRQVVDARDSTLHQAIPGKFPIFVLSSNSLRIHGSTPNVHRTPSPGHPRNSGEFMGTEERFSSTDSTLNSSSCVCKSVAYCSDPQLMCTWGKIERPETWVTERTGRYRPLPMSPVCTEDYWRRRTSRATARSAGCTRSIPRFSPSAGAVGCTDVQFPPKATKPVVQSSAHGCMHAHGML